MPGCLARCLSPPEASPSKESLMWILEDSVAHTCGHNLLANSTYKRIKLWHTDCPRRKVWNEQMVQGTYRGEVKILVFSLFFSATAFWKRIHKKWNPGLDKMLIYFWEFFWNSLQRFPHHKLHLFQRSEKEVQVFWTGDPRDHHMKFVCWISQLDFITAQ